ncbi:Zn(II)2Cys6 transcription factor domain-containing protein [Aspergillus homomorphus CBS 101889]|uniref:Zn(2)-C6 fungal-type domain-containing protein n=1 Tax=Aspergillus homomorphus (strain CBS 101889) TaxID=1450537 RepID=A0A395HHU1_ASPHC|nr:hypothetical protein BO97DRAFT_379243 [Aspergillus homomorphus CBS 101889]RAL07073.1 hypothetical protein BO97DRAFT_379243 [Aspergillus homomorphus CBS 101889]
MAPTVMGEISSRLNKSGRPRLKQWAPKVKSGCITCRIRRIKCDETKPSCTRCTSTGRNCDGYDELAIKQVIKPQHVVQMPSAWDQVSGSTVEIKNFAFFRSVTTADLAGFFDVGFWTGKLLQLSHQYPALWHAMTALACVHHEFITDRTPTTVARVGDTPNMRFALVQFNKSIQSLRKLLSGPSLTRLDKLVALSTCLLFTCMASLQGRQWQAFVHISSGLKMFHYWNLGLRNRDRRDDDPDIDLLLVAFTQLDTQARPYLPSQRNNLQWTDSQIILSSTIEPFRSLLDAYLAIEVHFNTMMRFMLSKEFSDLTLISENLIQKQKCGDDFQQWDARLSGFLSVAAPSEKDDRALNLLYIRRIFARIFLSLDFTKGELCHDDFLQDYKQMLDLATQLLDDLNSSHMSGERPSHPNFCLATTVAEPLFLIATRCREPTIRREALRLLKQYPRREGICEGMVAARIAETMIDIEEKGCNGGQAGSCTTGQWVCGNHRVAILQFVLIAERQMKILIQTVEDLICGRDERVLVTSYW